MKTSKVGVVVFLILLAVLSMGSLIAQRSEAVVSEDVYKAGGSVVLQNDVDGDVVVAGGKITIDHSVSEDVMAAGGTVTITAEVGDDIRAAGGFVTVSGNVGDDLIAAAYSVSLDSDSTVGGNARLSGRTVTVAGNVNQALSVEGGEVILSGSYGGDVEVHADSIELEPSAVIKGNLTYSTPGEATLADGAVIEGEIIRQEFSLSDPETWGEEVAGSLKFYLSLALCTIVIFLIYPRGSVQVAERLDEAPFKSLGLGFVVLVVVPIAAIVLLFTGLGVPLGLITLLVYLATLVASLLFALIWIGDAGFRLLGQKPDKSRWTRVWSILAAAVVLMLVDFIPTVGGWVFFAVMLLGIGAMKRYFYGLYVGLEGAE